MLLTVHFKEKRWKCKKIIDCFSVLIDTDYLDFADSDRNSWDRGLGEGGGETLSTPFLVTPLLVALLLLTVNHCKICDMPFKTRDRVCLIVVSLVGVTGQILVTCRLRELRFH